MTSSKTHGSRNIILRRGITLTEILVVVSILGVLFALVVPAVQAVRETARKTHCSANLRQLGIALNSYVTALGALPSKTNGKHGFSVHSMILPYLDNTSCYNALNFDVGCIRSANVTATKTPIAVFLCPSDYGNGTSGPWTNYACNVGYGYQKSQTYNGVFTVGRNNPITSLADITDGTSTTALAAEWVRGSENDLSHVVYRTKTVMIAASEYDSFISACQGTDVNPARSFSATKGTYWARGDHGKTAYTHDILIGGRSCYNHVYVREGAWTAASLHGHGSSVLFADGHLHFVRNSISLATWRAIGTRSGGEQVSIQDK
ncbi:DUF1559 family PulG-like putative transporter [Singulisphaera acidiphila]|uniref:Prepilin-type N-terminal cleavage/methylation domain-containing protein n=1 Tax=Singulisphaera acidiphila (strain ATCC BAA-1392 / DSM 18658 / VKM B-2454 / MOB10) TaxID=886293 RepID=L0DGN7_SINAD|nr:DUF1559 domain-containing protein [Singulisphaera acidiphila]AGA28422.1 prepilin-type N-terminal cleavage/methylation domain-containing protein [Singulisphaera acidiphila DSM 18658]